MVVKPKTANHFLREWRKHRRLTQEKLAEDAGLTPGAISQLENGLIGYTQTSLESLARALQCTPGDILSRDPADGAPVTDIGEVKRFLDRIAGLSPNNKAVALASISQWMGITAEPPSQTPSDDQSSPETLPHGSRSLPRQ